jgi:hypothetical protein
MKVDQPTEIHAGVCPLREKAGTLRRIVDSSNHMVDGRSVLGFVSPQSRGEE